MLDDSEKNMSTFANRTKKGTVALGVISAMLISSCSDSTDSASAMVLDVPMDVDIAEVNVDTEQGIDTNTEIVADNNNTIDVANVAGGEAEEVATDQPTTEEETELEETIPETDSDDLIPNTDAILNVGNALDIWRETVSVINEDQISQFIQLLTTDLNLPNAGLFIEQSVDAIEFSESIVLDSPYQYESAFGSNEFVSIAEGDSYTCISSGGIQIFPFPGGRDTVFSNCAVANVAYSGTIGIRNQFRGSISSRPFFDLVRVASDGMTTTLSGDDFGGNTSFVSIDRLDGWNDLNFRQFGAEAEFRLVDFNMRRTTIDSETNASSSTNGGTFVDTTFVTFNRYQLEDTIEGRFDVFAQWTGTDMGLSVTVDLSYFDDVLVGLEDPDIEFPSRDPVEPFNWEAGNVTISANDGSSIIITPSEAELGSFELELSNGEVIGPLPWLDEYFIDRQ